MTYSNCDARVRRPSPEATPKTSQPKPTPVPARRPARKRATKMIIAALICLCGSALAGENPQPTASSPGLSWLTAGILGLGSIAVCFGSVVVARNPSAA